MFWMGGKIPRLGYLAPRGEDTLGGGQAAQGGINCYLVMSPSIALYVVLSHCPTEASNKKEA